jgi:hypothetical protein
MTNLPDVPAWLGWQRDDAATRVTASPHDSRLLNYSPTQGPPNTERMHGDPPRRVPELVTVTPP